MLTPEVLDSILSSGSYTIQFIIGDYNGDKIDIYSGNEFPEISSLDLEKIDFKKDKSVDLKSLDRDTKVLIKELSKFYTVWSIDIDLNEKEKRNIIDIENTFGCYESHEKEECALILSVRMSGGLKILFYPIVYYRLEGLSLKMIVLDCKMKEE